MNLIIPVGPTLKIRHLQKVSFFYARFKPGFGQKWGVFIKDYLPFRLPDPGFFL